MKANELMIGDWVKIKTYGVSDKYERTEAYIWIKVAEIGSGLITVEYNNDIKEPYRICENTEIEPISLTPEILEKDGFVANKHVYPYPYYEYTNEEDKLKIGFAFPQGNKTSYKDPWVYIDSENVLIVHLPCIYVHQLQHALRLCRTEKEIIL